MRLRVRGRVLEFGKHWRVLHVNGKPRVMLGTIAMVDGDAEGERDMLPERYCDAAARAFGCIVDANGYIQNWDVIGPKLEDLKRERKARAWLLVEEAMLNMSLQIGAAGISPSWGDEGGGDSGDAAAG